MSPELKANLKSLHRQLNGMHSTRELQNAIRTTITAIFEQQDEIDATNMRIDALANRAEEEINGLKERIGNDERYGS